MRLRLAALVHEDCLMVSAQPAPNGTAYLGPPFLPLFWALVERHSALDVKVLRFLSDPVNLAIRAGYTFDRDAIQGECLFAVLPELRFGHLVQHKDGRVELVQNHDDDDDDEEDYDRPEHDPSLPPEPYFLFWHSTHRLKDDGLISTRDASFDDYMEGFEEMALSFGDDRPGVDGLYPGRPFESSTELGARYLAFLTEPPANLATPGGA